MSNDVPPATPDAQTARLIAEVKARRTAGGAPCREYVTKAGQEYGIGSCGRCGWFEPEHVIDKLLAALSASPSTPPLVSRFIPKRACEGADTLCLFDDKERQCPHSQCGAVIVFSDVPTVEDTIAAFQAGCELGNAQKEKSNA